MFGVCFFLKYNLLRENGKLLGYLPSTSLPSLGGCHGMISQAFQVLRRKGLLPQSPQNWASACEPPCCGLEQAPAGGSPTSRVAVNGPFGCVVILGVCAGTRELAPKRNLLYVYSPTSRAHLWPDVCLTDMSNRRAASREWPAQGHCSQLSHGAPRAAA